jgi:hypothetical protein
MNGSKGEESNVPNNELLSDKEIDRLRFLADGYASAYAEARQLQFLVAECFSYFDKGRLPTSEELRDLKTKYVDAVLGE